MVIRFLLEKEFRQMMRNAVLPRVFIALPLALLAIIPLVATQEVKNLKVGVVDADRSPLSERLVQKLAASDFFVLTGVFASYDDALRDLEQGGGDLILEIGPDFERGLANGEESAVMVSANAVNGVKAGLGSFYLAQVVAGYAAELRDEAGAAAAATGAGTGVASRYLFNPSLDYKAFMVPGLIAMLLVLVVGFLPALSIVGEKERGTIEQINVTPVGRFDFIFSKLIPYWCVGLFILTYAMLLSWLLYGLVPAGSVGLIYLFATLFILVVSCLGLIVSNYSDTTRQAALVMFFFLVIFILMSGLLTPVGSMPAWARALTCLNPLRYFIESMRMLYLKGSTFADLSPQFWTLGAYAAGVWTWAIASYRKHG